MILCRSGVVLIWATSFVLSVFLIPWVILNIMGFKRFPVFVDVRLPEIFVGNSFNHFKGWIFLRSKNPTTDIKTRRCTYLIWCSMILVSLNILQHLLRAEF